MKLRCTQGLAVYVLCLFAACMAAGQTPVRVTEPIPHASPAAAGKTPSNKTKEEIRRWFEIDQLALSARYHFIELENHAKSADNLQYQFVARSRFKFDRQGRYSIAANAATGTAFNSGWNATGIGTGDVQRDVFLKQLYFDAKPVKEVEVQAGGLFINYGLSTEVTQYDNDGYIMGERLIIRHPKKLYFDQLSITYASLGDLNTPNVFRRFRHFDKQNYHQFLVQKQITKAVGFSADYTFQSGMDLLHQAVRFTLPKKQVLDTLLFENYERLDPGTDYGFNLFGEKAVHNRVTLSGGFARIGPGLLNADRFPRGKRVYLNTVFKLSPEFSFAIQATQGVGRILPAIPRTRVDVVLSYNILRSLKRTGLF